MKIKLTYDQLFQKHLDWLNRKGNQAYFTTEDHREIDDLVNSELEYDTDDLVRIQDRVRAAGIKNCFLLTRNIPDSVIRFRGNDDAIRSGEYDCGWAMGLYGHCRSDLCKNLNQNAFSKGLPDDRMQIWNDQLPHYNQYLKIIEQIQPIRTAVISHRPHEWDWQELQAKKNQHKQAV